MSRISELPKPLVTVLSPLVYLYKSNDYAYEKEVRIVIPFSDLENGLYLHGSSVAGRPAGWRHFAEVPSLQVPELFVSESRIFLGPTVESAANVDQRGHLNRLLRLAPPFFVDATVCAQTFAQMRRHPELAVWVGDLCLHEPHRRSSRDRSGSP